jgi:hypothetical protein
MPGKGARRAGPGFCVDTEPMSRASGLKGAACQYGDLLQCRRPTALQRAVWLNGSVAACAINASVAEPNAASLSLYLCER